jgi:L-alanine-DL-glutamate epimerase-like enolase superfamily enzyme
MIIAKIETFPLRIPLQTGYACCSLNVGGKGLPVADSLFRVSTDQGLEGWGEAFGFRAVQSEKLAVDELVALLSVQK